MRSIQKYLKIISFLSCVFYLSYAQSQSIKYTTSSSIFTLGKRIEVLETSKKDFNDTSILSAKEFHLDYANVPVFFKLNVNVWCRFSLKNYSSDKLYLYIESFNISKITLYKLSQKKLVKIYIDGNSQLQQVDNDLPIYISNLFSSQNENEYYYLHIESEHPVIFTAYIGSYRQIKNQDDKHIFVLSAYFGIMAVIFFYNLFLFFSTKDWSYLTYIWYIFFLTLAQFTLAGYAFKFLWLNHPAWNYYAVPITSNIAGILGVLFAIQFLRTKHYVPIVHKILIVNAIIFCAGVLLTLLHANNLSYFILDFNSPVVGVISLITSLYISSKNYRPALYYAISWLFFLSGLVVFSLCGIGVIPINAFTTYILYIGSAVETVLLSIALADNINILKKETLQRAKENEQLVRDQNVDLEKKVEERTHELQASNAQLNGALVTLKDAQTQLVESEKMASLGQLTAGIAHEINNPINFVKSNINPLRLDVKDLMDVLNEYDSLHTVNDEPAYKKKLQEIQRFKKQIDVDFVQREIDNLIVGIEEGAERTAEIVQGLRTFSRLDEAELKTVDIHEGILSTLVLLKNATPYYIKIIKDFKATSHIECYPGKLNQVFMNMISNAIQAITAKKDEINDNESIIISSKDVNDDCVEISIKDTGIGMTEDVKQRIFEPFFTTKEVGEGTGLGMAIVFKILQKHDAKIQIITKPLKGSEFIITLPYKHPVSDHL